MWREFIVLFGGFFAFLASFDCVVLCLYCHMFAYLILEFQIIQLNVTSNSDCYDEELFNKRLSFFSSWGGDPYPFRGNFIARLPGQQCC